jgi:hypothetical protein
MGTLWKKVTLEIEVTQRCLFTDKILLALDRFVKMLRHKESVECTVTCPATFKVSDGDIWYNEHLQMVFQADTLACGSAKLCPY